jgi:site-specific recombinase XerD
MILQGKMAKNDHIGPPDSEPRVLAPATVEQSKQPVLVAESARAAEYAQRSKAANTRRAYNLDWRLFVEWCERRDLDARQAKPAAVAAFLADMADSGYAAVSISRMATGIKHYMRRIDPPSWPHATEQPEVVRITLSGIRRTLGVAPKWQKSAVTLSMLKRMLPHMGEGLEGRRNRAILLTGFFCSMRRSDVSSLDVEDVVVSGKGMIVVSRRGKTDQEAESFERGVTHQKSASICAPCEVTRWLQESGIKSGALFRELDGHTVTDERIKPSVVTALVQHGVKSIGLDTFDYGAHSLRVGLVTDASGKGKSLQAIMRQTGHRKVETVMRYIRHATLFDDNVTEGLDE